MTVQAALTKGIGMLKDAGVEGHIRDARLLMACSLGIGVERLTLHDTSKLLDMQEASFLTRSGAGWRGGRCRICWAVATFTGVVLL